MIDIVKLEGFVALYRQIIDLDREWNRLCLIAWDWPRGSEMRVKDQAVAAQCDALAKRRAQLRQQVKERYGMSGGNLTTIGALIEAFTTESRASTPERVISPLDTGDTMVVGHFSVVRG